ncbi:MAG: FG-GAP-like repeat-containing protein [Nitrospirales bacterium]
MAETHAATITIINKDTAGEGFNDPTAFTPVGGNTATTLGQARLNAFQYAANILEQLLVSNVVIKVDAQIDPLGSGVLGSAGPNTIHRDFNNAPVANTWYVQALANKLFGQDLDINTSDINATFSSNFSNWYFGLDANPPIGKFDFATVVLHEIIHGLGFLSLVDVLNGQKFLGRDDVYMRWLEHHGAFPADYPSMTGAQHLSASLSINNLHFVGPQLQGASGILTAGRTGSHVQMYAPNPVQPGSSVSHFTNTIKPDQLMEPGISSGTAIHDIGLAQALFKDLGWVFVVGGSAPVSVPLNDLDGNGQADLVWRNTISGEVIIWLMNGATVAASASLGQVSTIWNIEGTGDVNGDGKADVIWQNSTSGEVVIWLMDGLTVQQVAVLGGVAPNWSIEGVGDVDGDGKADLVWRESNGAVALWLMNGVTIKQVGVPSGAATNWSIEGVGDVDGDSKADLIWRESTNGALAVWLMNGVTITQVGVPAGVATNWSIEGVGDVDGDSKADLVWRDLTSGAVVVWAMDGLTVGLVGFPGSSSLDWEFR